MQSQDNLGRTQAAKRVVAIARNTFREAVRDRVLYNLVLFVLLLTACAIFIGELSGGEERRITIDLGLSAMLLFGVFFLLMVLRVPVAFALGLASLPGGGTDEDNVTGCAFVWNFCPLLLKLSYGGLYKSEYAVEIHAHSAVPALAGHGRNPLVFRKPDERHRARQRRRVRE
jgi:hypothetical protein